MQQDHEAMIKQLEEAYSTKITKAQKTTKLMICLQNRVREMVAAKLDAAVKKLQERENAFSSLKEDLADVTESHNLKVIQLKEAFEKAKQDETSHLIQKHEAEVAAFEKRIREEVSSAASRSE